MSGFRVSTASIIFYPSLEKIPFYMFDNLIVPIVCLKIGYFQQSKVDFICWLLNEPGEKVWTFSGMTMPLSEPRDRAVKLYWLVVWNMAFIFPSYTLW